MLRKALSMIRLPSGRELAITGTATCVGRANLLPVVDLSASREHCSVQRLEGSHEVLLRSISRRNPTYVLREAGGVPEELNAGLPRTVMHTR